MKIERGDREKRRWGEGKQGTKLGKAHMSLSGKSRHSRGIEGECVYYENKEEIRYAV